MFQKGHSGHYPKDGLTKHRKDVKRAFQELLELNTPQLQVWLEKVAEKNPAKALEVFIEISKRFVPTLTNTTIEGEITHVIQPPTIIKRLDTGDSPELKQVAGGG